MILRRAKHGETEQINIWSNVLADNYNVMVNLALHITDFGKDN